MPSGLEAGSRLLSGLFGTRGDVHGSDILLQPGVPLHQFLVGTMQQLLQHLQLRPDVVPLFQVLRSLPFIDVSDHFKLDNDDQLEHVIDKHLNHKHNVHLIDQQYL